MCTNRSEPKHRGENTAGCETLEAPKISDPVCTVTLKKLFDRHDAIDRYIILNQLALSSKRISDFKNVCAMSVTAGDELSTIQLFPNSVTTFSSWDTNITTQRRRSWSCHRDVHLYAYVVMVTTSGRAYVFLTMVIFVIEKPFNRTLTTLLQDTDNMSCSL